MIRATQTDAAAKQNKGSEEEQYPDTGRKRRNLMAERVSRQTDREVASEPKR